MIPTVISWPTRFTVSLVHSGWPAGHTSPFWDTKHRETKQSTANQRSSKRNKLRPRACYTYPFSECEIVMSMLDFPSMRRVSAYHPDCVFRRRRGSGCAKTIILPAWRQHLVTRPPFTWCLMFQKQGRPIVWPWTCTYQGSYGRLIQVMFLQ